MSEDVRALPATVRADDTLAQSTNVSRNIPLPLAVRHLVQRVYNI